MNVSLSVLSVVWGMIAQWENEWISLSVLSMAWAQISSAAEFFEGFSLADHMHCLVYRSGKTKS